MGIIAAAKGSSKAKQLAAQLIPRFFKYFPSLSAQAINAQLDLCEEDELGVSFPAALPVGFQGLRELNLRSSSACVSLGAEHEQGLLMMAH